MEVTFSRKWEGGHRFFEDKESLCYQPHGHSWKVAVTLKYPEFKLNNSSNKIVPFYILKSQWHNWIDNCIDHSFIYNHRDPLLEFMMKDSPKGRHVVVPGDPTTEIIAVSFKAKCEAFLKNENSNFTCESILIQETITNKITFSEDPQLHLPKGNFWWNRPDMSTRD